MLSVANIPLLGFNFEGLIAYLIVNGKAYRLATYTEVFMRTLTNTIMVLHLLLNGDG